MFLNHVVNFSLKIMKATFHVLFVPKIKIFGVSEGKMSFALMFLFTSHLQIFLLMLWTMPFQSCKT